MIIRINHKAPIKSQVSVIQRLLSDLNTIWRVTFEFDFSMDLLLYQHPTSSADDSTMAM